MKTKIGKKHVVTLLGFHQPSFSLGNVSNKVRQRLLVLEIWWSSFFGQREPLRLSKVKPSKKKQSTMHRYSNFSPIFRVKHSGKFPSEPPLRVDWFHTDLQKKPLWWHHQYAEHKQTVALFTSLYPHNLDFDRRLEHWNLEKRDHCYFYHFVVQFHNPKQPSLKVLF